MVLERRQREKHDVANLVAPTGERNRRLAINLADDVSQAFDMYMISHGVSEADVAARAITMLYAIDARLSVDTRIVAFRVGLLDRRRCTELISTSIARATRRSTAPMADPKRQRCRRGRTGA